MFGIYKTNCKVLTFDIPDRKSRTLIPLMAKYIKASSLYYTDDWFAYTYLDMHGNHVVIKESKGQ